MAPKEWEKKSTVNGLRDRYLNFTIFSVAGELNCTSNKKFQETWKFTLFTRLLRRTRGNLISCRAKMTKFESEGPFEMLIRIQ